MHIPNFSYSLVIGLLGLSQLACARVPHHRHHRRHAEVASSPTETAAVVEGPPDDAVVSVAPPPNGAVVASIVSEVVASVVGVVETASVVSGADVTVAVTYVIEPLSTTALGASSYVIPGIPTNTSVGLAPSGNSTATAIDATSRAPIPTAIAGLNSTTAAIPPVTSARSNSSSILPPAPTVAFNSSLTTNTTLISSALPSITPPPALNSTTPSTTPSTNTTTKSKATRTWTSLSAPTSLRPSTSTPSLPAITAIPTTPCSSLRLSFSMPTYSSRRPPPPQTTSIVDLSSLPANVSANAPCYADSCPNPDSGMNYRTTVHAQVDMDNGLFTGGAAGRGGRGLRMGVVGVVVGVVGVLVLL